MVRSISLTFPDPLQPSNLQAFVANDDTLLVKDLARFEFAGFGGFNLAQVTPHVVFGFGTNACI
jgi:hypothetical protein